MNARPVVSGRGWIVTGAISTPLIAVETNSRPEGSSRKATGAPAISQAARQTARRASSPSGEHADDAADRAHPARVVAQRVVEPAQVALVGLALELVGEHAREHREELLVVDLEGGRAGRERGQRADAGAVGELERHAEVGAGAGAALGAERAVDRVAAEVVAQPRRALLGHREVVGFGHRRGEVGAQPERRPAARVDDPVHGVRAIEVREVQRALRHQPLEQVEDGPRRIGERSVRGRRSGSRRLDRAHVHADIIVAPRPILNPVFRPAA